MGITPGLPPDMAKKVGERLRFMRQAKNRNIGQLEHMHASTLTNYELHDPSTMQLTHMYHLALDLGYAPGDLLRSVAAALGDEPPEVTVLSRAEITASRFLRLLTEDQQELALKLLGEMVDHYAGSEQKNKAKRAGNFSYNQIEKSQVKTA